MPDPFAITAATNTLRLDDKRQAETSFSVFNNSGRQIRGRARVVPQNPVSETWLSLVGDAEKDFPIAGTQQFGVHITVPPDAPAGSYPFRLDVVGVDNPDEELSQGPTVTFEVPAPVAVKKAFPIWIPLVIVGVLLLVGGLITFLTLRGGGSGGGGTPTVTATATVSANSQRVTFESRPVGVLQGNEFAFQGIYVSPYSETGHCNAATLTAILPAGTYSHTPRRFLTSASPSDIRLCNTVPIQIVFVNPVKRVSIVFGGDDVDYTLTAFDRGDEKVLSATDRPSIGSVTIELSSAQITRATFGASGAITAIMEIFYSW